MRITEDMKVKEALKAGDRMIEAFAWLAPEFERLRRPVVRKALAGRVTISQAARIAGIPLTEALYVLNLAAGEEGERLADELRQMPRSAFEYAPENPPRKPRELLGLKDTDERVHFVDLTPLASLDADPQPVVMRELSMLADAEEVLLVRHPFDPIPLRDHLARRGFASWAEERRPHDWYVYFYRPHTGAGAAVRPPEAARPLARAAVA